ncbi:hypothetical protein EUX98_g2420 [Antrodiella citrinella]|uniref:FAS1 domain-containing protein n=1 Tax=Antrodiella citrinella TaxID=2447956 RepID=A0A4S4MZ18_9APHY|nr:hypothetical protein EUX98_g2420 [Antrodiella citrinella]
MLVHRILTAVTLGILSVSALPGSESVLKRNAVPKFIDLGVVPQEPLWSSDDFPAPKFPHGPPPHWDPKVSKKTIYEFLKDDDHFTRLFKLVNFTNEIINTLNDSSASLTLFAPPNSALRPPKRSGNRCNSPFILSEDFEACFLDENKDLSALESLAALEALVDEDHDDHKKEILKRIVGAILSYHILPHSLSAADLAKNTTFGTSYAAKDGAFDGKPLRIHVAGQWKLLHPTLVVNFYAKVVKPDIQTANGVVHVTNHPVLPPPSAFQELFLFSDYFSTFTSAVQRTGLTDAADWHYIRGKDGEKGTVEGSPSITVFAPINAAWKKLPWKLRLFLFSPFGEKILGKLVQYHVVPDVILHSDYFHNATDSVVSRSADPECCIDAGVDELKMFGVHEPVFMGLDAHIKTPTEQEKRPGNLQPTNLRDGGPFGLVTNALGVIIDYATRKIVAVEPDLNPHHWQCINKPPHHDPVYAHSSHLPTLFTNHTLHVHVAQYEHRSPIPPHSPSYFTRLIVNGVVVKAADVPARNGAVHVIDKVLNPRAHKGHHHHDPGRHITADGQVSEEDEWQGWEDWLVKWADEN